MRVVSVLAVGDPSIWKEIEAAVDLDGHVVEVVDPTHRIVDGTFADEAVPDLERHGIHVLVRYARRAHEDGATSPLAERVASLRAHPLRILHAAQRHAFDGRVRGLHAWDPEHDAEAVQTLHAAGLLRPDPEDPTPGRIGRFHLVPDLPAPPRRRFDFSEALMPETDDLPEPGPGPTALLQDMAGLAAALAGVQPKRTFAGTLARADARRLGRRLGVPELASDGLFETHSRWARALQGLEALGAVSMDPIQRELFLDLGVEDLLGGTTSQAEDRLIRRLVSWDLHPLLDAVRAALHQAGDEAVDEAIFFELLHDQARDLLFPGWEREGGPVYPHVESEAPRPYDDIGWESVEERLGHKALKALARLGLLRRAPGIFAATPDGRAWAATGSERKASLWAGSDLELVVPPGALTPWERFQIERLTRCLGRDVVDRHVLEQEALVRWLATHELDEALTLLRLRCLNVPTALVETLQEWARSASRVVLTRGVLLD
jgi:hypothetical protein